MRKYSCSSNEAKAKAIAAWVWSWKNQYITIYMAFYWPLLIYLSTCASKAGAQTQKGVKAGTSKSSLKKDVKELLFLVGVWDKMAASLLSARLTRRFS